jgi:16S rRNA (cytosine1402-N4)-methyltransferase
VLLTEALQYLAVRPGSTVVDATVGLAGHAAEIARRLGRSGTLIAFDRDPEALELSRQRLAQVASELGQNAPQIRLVDEAFSGVAEHVAPGSVDALLADFGVSSLQLDNATRGFSFSADGPLDMRQDARQALTAAQVVNEVSERELANLVYEYGEERRSRRIARAVVRARPILTTAQLARVIASAAPSTPQDRIRPETKSFQAIRIYVNRELDEIQALLEAAPKLLKPSGRLVVISFHSLEDRLAKDSLREGAHRGIWKILTKKPITAGEEENQKNPRSRSAKLRAAERTALSF